jgi:SprT-like family
VVFIREDYLQRSLREWRKIFRKHGYEIPEVHISVAPLGRGATGGICYEKDCSSDKRNQILISSLVNRTWHIQAVLAHEAIHAYLDCEHGHTKPFQDIATAIGLVSPFSSCTVSQLMEENTKRVVQVAGKYRGPKFGARPIHTQTCGIGG